MEIKTFYKEQTSIFSIFSVL